MSKYHLIESKMWHDGWFGNLTTEGKLLWIYIKTTSTAATLRIYNVPSKLVSIETGIDEIRINELLIQFVNEGKMPMREQYRLSEAERDRTSRNYIEWRIAVFERDNHACRKCGSRNQINAHHIKQWALYRELRFDVSNGLTLCKKCHKLERVIRVR